MEKLAPDSAFRVLSSIDLVPFKSINWRCDLIAAISRFSQFKVYISPFLVVGDRSNDMSEKFEIVF